MISLNQKTKLKWTFTALTLTLVVGCSGLTTPINPTDNSQGQKGAPITSQQDSNTGTSHTPTVSESTSPAPTASAPTASPTLTPAPVASVAQQSGDSSQTLLSNMIHLAKLGKVINSDFPVKTTTIGDVEKLWGQADSTDYVAAAKGRYATFSSNKIVFGINKGEQIFEVRSFDSRLTSLSLSNVKAILGTPAYDAKSNGQEIIGYTAGPEFKIEIVFSQPTTSNPDPVIDHYSVLYPQGTVNSMADDPGRQW